MFVGFNSASRRSTLAETLLGIETSFGIMAPSAKRGSTLAETLLGIETKHFALTGVIPHGSTLAETLLGIETWRLRHSWLHDDVLLWLKPF